MGIHSFDPTDQVWLHRPVSAFDVEEAVFQMGALKALGFDGLPSIFYQRNWHLVGQATTSFVIEAFRQG